MALKITEITTESIIISPHKESSYIPSQRKSWINYKTKDEYLVIKTPPVITECYGVPKEGTFYLTDKSRAFYKLGFCHERAKYNEEVDYNDIKDFYDSISESDDSSSPKNISNDLSEIKKESSKF